MPIIDKVGRKKIVVSEYDLDRTDGGLESGGTGEKIRQEGSLPAVAFAQRVRVVAHDMEHPEHRSWAAQVLWNVPVTSPHHVDEALEVGRVAHILRRECASLDEVEHENSGLCVHHAGAQAGQMRRLARRQLVGAHDPVNENIAPDPHDIAASSVFDRAILVGDSAGQRLRVHAAEPDRKRGDARRRTLLPTKKLSENESLWKDGARTPRRG